MVDVQIAFMEQSDLQESVRVLSLAMLNNPLHVAVFQGNGETERLHIEKMFYDLFSQLPGIVFLARENRKIVGVMRMKSCVGSQATEEPKDLKDETDIQWRKSILQRDWATHDPSEQHWHLGPIGVLPSHQGMGVGSRLMRRFCKEVDACAAKAYLETDLDENVRFYQNFGFTVISRSTVFEVENRYMERAART